MTTNSTKPISESEHKTDCPCRLEAETWGYGDEICSMNCGNCTCNKPVTDGSGNGIDTDHERAVKGGYPDAYIRKTSDKHWAVFAEGKRLGGYSLLQETAWCYARVDPFFSPKKPLLRDSPVQSETPLRAVINHLRDEEADYLLGRCMPLLQILDENEQAVELLADIRKYAFGEEVTHE
jgi:hypothetical protein